jgi:polyisoprenoid-binding protein YceI
MMLHAARFALALALLTTTQKSGDATAAFEGKGPGGFKLKGTTHAVDLADDGTTLSVVVHLGRLETGIGLRDKHMREKYLQVDQFADAVLRVPWASVHLPEDGQRVQGQTTGTMELHGKSKEVGFSYSIVRTGSSYAVTGSLPLNMNDFGITVPSYMGLTVQPEVVATCSLSASRP